mmetsp:Transcript_22052/g.66157  ORF Transcript_22052/g.66157 Transcript_22052/m.66157 type:complete len:268 (-) Transcript_22052:123-926(-)
MAAVVTSPAPLVLNVDFLRSGAEIRDAKAVNPDTKRGVSSPPRTRNRRLDDFYNKTLEAFKPADLDAWDGLPTARRAAVAPTASTPGAGPAVINVDFLRSGAEFKTYSTIDRPVTDAMPSPRSSRNARLEEFHRRSLEAAGASTMGADDKENAAGNAESAATLDAWDGMPMAENAPTIVNMDFLRTKAYAETQVSPSPVAGVDSPRTTRSKNQRLENFYKASLQGVSESQLCSAVRMHARTTQSPFVSRRAAYHQIVLGFPVVHMSK